VEVKTRRTEFVTPEEQVHWHKEGRIRHAAEVYLTRFHGDPPAVRFDVIAVVWPQGSRRPTIRHVPGAFS
jgi:Holliday junction resolvase-like predicted endonuclease